MPSLAARSSVYFKELENAGLGEEHIPGQMRFSSVTILNMPQWVRWLPRNRKDEDKWADDPFEVLN